MRAITTSDGHFALKDEPTQIHGEDAERFLSHMADRDAAADSADQAAFDRECERIYLTNLDKLST